MGATKEMFTQMQEAECNENNPYYELLGRLQKKEVTLSYSSLKEFGKSPMNFIRYKLKEEREQTDSQIFGSLCDCLITEPDKFENKFIINDVCPTTDNQRGFCEDMIKGLSAEDAFKSNYSRGNAKDLEEQFMSYINAKKSGKTVITQELYDEAKDITDNLLKSELITQYINSCSGFQNKLEWNYEGWNFIGFTDASSDKLIIDLKYTKDADPDKFERDIMNYEYYLQMAMYAQSLEGVPECYFIAYDKSKNFSLIKVDYSLLSYGIRKYQYLVSKLNQCIKENRFDESYNFFDVQLRTVYKPKWVKGFETDKFDEE